MVTAIRNQHAHVMYPFINPIITYKWNHLDFVVVNWLTCLLIMSTRIICINTILKPRINIQQLILVSEISLKYENQENIPVETWVQSLLLFRFYIYMASCSSVLKGLPTWPKTLFTLGILISTSTTRGVIHQTDFWFINCQKLWRSSKKYASWKRRPLTDFLTEKITILLYFSLL